MDREGFKTFIRNILKEMLKEKRMHFYNNEYCFQIWFCHAAQCLIERDTNYSSLRLVPEYSSSDYNSLFSKGSKRIDILFYDISSKEKYLIELKYKTRKNKSKTVYSNHDLKMSVGGNNKIDSMYGDLNRTVALFKEDKKLKFGCLLLATNWTEKTKGSKIENNKELKLELVNDVVFNELDFYWRILENEN
jgi:hypothetical protein